MYMNELKPRSNERVLEDKIIRKILERIDRHYLYDRVHLIF